MTTKKKPTRRQLLRREADAAIRKLNRDMARKQRAKAAGRGVLSR
jgi:hypothetical protein